jgi:hypothetical protein
MNPMKIQLRYNTNSENEFDKWRLIIDGVQHIVSEVLFECQTVTTCDLVDVNGVQVEKYHLSAIAQDTSFYYGGASFVRVIVS